MSPPLLESSTYVAFRSLIPPLGCREFEAIKQTRIYRKMFLETAGVGGSVLLNVI